MPPIASLKVVFVFIKPILRVDQPIMKLIVISLNLSADAFLGFSLIDFSP